MTDVSAGTDAWGTIAAMRWLSLHVGRKRVLIDVETSEYVAFDSIGELGRTTGGFDGIDLLCVMGAQHA